MIKELLINKTGIERANIKSEAIAKLVVGKFTDDQYGVEVEIKSIEKIEGGIQLYARAWKGTKQLGFGADGTVEWERFRIFNPPIMVPDGTKKTVTDETGLTHEIDNFKEAPLEALQKSLAHTVKLTGKTDTKIVAGSLGHTVSTFYPDAGTGGTTVDGIAMRNGDETWATKRTSAGTHAFDTANPQNVLFSDSATTNQFQELRRFLLTLPTTTIGTDDISATVLSLYGQSQANNLGCSPAPDIDIYTATPASDNAIVAADYLAVGSVSQTGSPIAYASWNTAAYNDFTFNATGRGNVNKTTISRFSARNANYDVSGTTPPYVGGGGGSQSYLGFYTADQAGTTNDPKLVVTHAAAASGPANLKSLNTNLKANIKSYNTNLIANVKSINTNV
jgi:hypothetical protein